MQVIGVVVVIVGFMVVVDQVCYCLGIGVVGSGEDVFVVFGVCVYDCVLIVVQVCWMQQDIVGNVDFVDVVEVCGKGQV